jgi:hypothetical protein
MFGLTYQGLAQSWEGSSPGRSRATMVIWWGFQSGSSGFGQVRMAAVERPQMLLAGNVSKGGSKLRAGREAYPAPKMVILPMS